MRKIVMWASLVLALATTALTAGCTITPLHTRQVTEQARTIAPAAAPAPSMTPAAPAVRPVETSTAHTDCNGPAQEGCVELLILNLRFNPQNKEMVGLDRPYANPTERQHRAQFLAPTLLKEYQAGRAEASAERTFLVYFWNVNSVPAGNLLMRRVDGTKVRHLPVEDVTGSVPMAKMDTLGTPVKVYRVRTQGAKPIIGTLMMPWSMLTGQTHILVCTEPGDHSTVYPNRITALNGHHVSAASLGYLKAKGSKAMMMAFLSQN